MARPRVAAVLVAVAVALAALCAADALSAAGQLHDVRRDEAANVRVLRAVDRVEDAAVRASLAGAPATSVRGDLQALWDAELRDSDGEGGMLDLAATQRSLEAPGPERAVRAPQVLDALLRFRSGERAELAEHHARAVALLRHTVLIDGAGLLLAALLLAGAIALRRGRPRERAAKHPPVAPQALPERSAAVPVDAREREVGFAAIVDTAFDAFIGVDADGRITRWNSRAEELFGWSKDDAIGRPVLGTALGPPHGPTPLSPQDLWALADGRPDEPAELVAWHRSGRSFPVEVALATAGGTDRMLQAFVRDISRRRARDRREAAVHAVTRVLADADSLVEASGELLREVCTAYEWSAGTIWVPAEHGGEIQPVETWTDGSVRSRTWAQACDGARLREGEGLPGQAWQIGGVAYRSDHGTADDDPRSEPARRALLRAGVCLPLLIEGEVVGVIELVGPARRPIERTLLDDLAAIQQVVASFVERRRARAETERAKREFLALVSHELRTPLTSILGYLQMLDARLAGAGEAERRSVEIIRRNADRLHRLVGDLLTSAEVSRGRLTLERGEVCLAALARDAVDAAAPAAAARGIVVASDLEPVPVVDADGGRLSQVLDNLLSNAIKFSHEGGRVEVRARAIEHGVELSVTDHGIGVCAGDLDRLAQQFFRASTARKAQVPGMGLGLSLSRAIVEEHGGRLHVDSVEGEGTTVTVVVPLPALAVSA